MIAVGLLQHRQIKLLNGDMVEMSPLGSLYEGRVDTVAGFEIYLGTDS